MHHKSFTFILLFMFMTMTTSLVPLIHIPTSHNALSSDKTKKSLPTKMCDGVSRDLVDALRTSGFLLVTSPVLSPDLQNRALEAACKFLESKRNLPDVKIISHPTDPKEYAMLDSHRKCYDVAPALKEYMEAMQVIKMDILRHIAKGLELDDECYFEKLHNENNDTLRLIKYNSTTEENGNRCKEHSDYGTITLLSTDGVCGLEVCHEGLWYPVPHVNGALVVNIGSLLSGWTKGNLLATLHRVAGPASSESQSPREGILKAAKSTRTSIAFFADPNENVSKSLSLRIGEDENLMKETLNGMSISEYILYRSGGCGNDRVGIDFIKNEKDRIEK